MQATPVTTCKNTQIKYIGIGMCCVCITWGNFGLSEIMVFIFRLS